MCILCATDLYAMDLMLSFLRRYFQNIINISEMDTKQDNLFVLQKYHNKQLHNPHLTGAVGVQY